MKAIKNCRACDSTELIEFLDLGKQYLSDFREDDSLPPRYPLVALFCEDCKLVQLKHTTPQVEMYHQNYGFKSGINEKIREDLDDAVLHAFQYINDPKAWLDIASNDGTLLSFVPDDIYRVGVDPVKFLCEEAGLYADSIINDYFSRLHFITDWEGDNGSARYQRFDVITSISCFYDMPDPSLFVEDVLNVLAPKGIWIIQQNYLLTTLQLNAVDNFCHEHLTYYTLLSLENLLNRYGLEVIEVSTSTVNGGSIRTVVARKGDFQVHESVGRQRFIELEANLADIKPYRTFADEVGLELNKLRRLVVDLKSEGHTIAILAASTRGATIWQSCDFGPDLVDYAVERNPAKVGKMFSAIGIPIISEEEAHRRHPNFMIIGPWFFADQIIDREVDYLNQGGRLITPFPEVKVIYGN